MLIRLKKYYILPGHGQIDFGGKVLTRTRHAALCISNSITVLSMHCFLQWRGKHTPRPMKTKEEREGKWQRRAGAHLPRRARCLVARTEKTFVSSPSEPPPPPPPSSFKNQSVSFLTDANKWLNKPALERRRGQPQFVKIGTQELDKRTTTSCSVRRKR